MLENINAAYVQFLTLLSFGISVLAAVLAIDTFRLLRTAQIGHSWRILCVSSVLFAFTLALRLAESFHWGGLHRFQLSRFSELIFIFGICYAFYLQRQAFSHTREPREETLQPNERPLASLEPMDDVDDLAKYYAEGSGQIKNETQGNGSPS